MIIIKLMGGLGNQLFQYSFARSLSHDLNEELIIDVSNYNLFTRFDHVIYGLHPFNIKGVVGDYHIKLTEEYSHINYHHFGEPFTLQGFYSTKTIKKIENLKTPAYFSGYYSNGYDDQGRRVMTENFFKHNIDLIHEDLKYLLPLSVEYQEIANDMSSYDAIALHVRRGEYCDISNFGTCSPEYYQEAIDLIVSKVNNPKFFIFTEDHEWVKENLDIPYPHRHIVFEKKLDAIGRGYAELLKIFSLCDHFIIANSTFSWWGSFLGENNDKIIISPSPWFQSREILFAETIDNKKPINILNNQKGLYDKSSEIMLCISNDNWRAENLNVFYSNDVLLLKEILPESKLFIKNHNGVTSDGRGYILKISLECDSPNIFRIFYKTNDEDDFSDKNSLNLFYYNNDSFEQYLFLPANVNLDELLIKPEMNFNPTNKEIIIKEFTIKKLVE